MSQQPYAEQRKIDPARRPAAKADGTPDDNDRVEIGPTALAFDEWQNAGLTPPNLAAMRKYRLDRLAAQISARDYAGVLLFDPLNIRYASDTTNMQLWATHNPFRACFVSAGGYMVVWDFKASNLLTGHNPLVRETRDRASFFYFVNGDKARDDAAHFAADLDDLVRQHAGANRRVAVDKLPIHGVRALDDLGFEIHDGEELMEKTRVVKGPDEVHAMRCAVHACERSMDEMLQVAAPGLCEAEIWSALHAANIKRGGEWIETRIMSSGPRTNPWFQECGPRIVQNNELLAFDTDLVGCYGMCADLSRTWFLGDQRPSDEQRRLFHEAHQQITQNMALLEPGMRFKDITFNSRPLPEEYVDLRYSVMIHGVGLCDEWPAIAYPQDYREGAFEYVLEPGMTLCVEAYIGARGGKDGIKLEDQVLITDNGHENLTHYPFDQALLS